MKTDKELAQELLSKLTGDVERDHEMADDFLCDVLIALGYKELAETFIALEKWHA